MQTWRFPGLTSAFNLLSFLPDSQKPLTSHTRIQPTRPPVRPRLPRIDAAAKRRGADDLQRTRPGPRRRAVAVGDRAQARAVRQERPGGLCGCAAPWRLSARHSLDRRRVGTVACRTLLADAVLQVPANADDAAAGEAAGRDDSRFSRVVLAATVSVSVAVTVTVAVAVIFPGPVPVQVPDAVVAVVVCTIAATEERDPALFLVVWRSHGFSAPLLVPTSLFCSFLSPLVSAFFQPNCFSSMLCDTYFVASISSCLIAAFNRPVPAPSSFNLRYYVIASQTMDSYHNCCPCPWNLHIHTPSSNLTANDPINQCCRSKLLYVC